MINVFISYRRSDTQDLAGRIADRLRASSVVGRVFIDVEEIEPGADFPRKIREALDGSDVCLILIGKSWRGEPPDGGTARIFGEQDYVRLEVAAALASSVKVMPILANGADMPSENQLPQDLQRLPQINAISVRHTYFEHDIAYLIDTLRGQRKQGVVKGYLARHPIQAGVMRALAGGLAAGILLFIAAAIHGAMTSKSLSQTLGGEGPVWVLIVVTLALGVSAAALVGPLRRRLKSGRV